MKIENTKDKIINHKERRMVHDREDRNGLHTTNLKNVG